MTLFKNKYRIESARLQNWDYSSNGFYFITICVKNKIHDFGEIVDGKMILSEMGKIADTIWQAISDQFPFVKLHEYVVMPDHVHGIIEHVGVSVECTIPRIDTHPAVFTRPNTRIDARIRRGAINRASTDTGITDGHGITDIGHGDTDVGVDTCVKKCISGGITAEHNPMLNPFSISKIIRWFKGRTTYEINKLIPGNEFEWQSRFYDRIIRDDIELHNVKRYILKNPENWYNKTGEDYEKDHFN